MNKKKTSLLSGFILIFLFLSYLFLDGSLTAKKETLRGRPTGGDFTLQSEQGPLRMSSLRGNIVLIYFGFTSCPDVCPTTLSNVSAAFKKIPAQQLDKVKMVFITVDPQRDSLEKMKGYAAYFHPGIIPLSGSEEQLHEVATKYGAYFRKVPIKSALSYTMDHSTNIFVVNQQGEFVDVINYGSGPDEIVSIIQKHFK